MHHVPSIKPATPAGIEPFGLGDTGQARAALQSATSEMAARMKKVLGDTTPTAEEVVAEMRELVVTYGIIAVMFEGALHEIDLLRGAHTERGGDLVTLT